MMNNLNTSALTAASALASLAKEAPHNQRIVSPCPPDPTLTRKRSAKKIKPLTFPQKLMQVLSIEEYSDIIVWLPHGEAFAIVNPREFVSEILPNFFKRAKYSSFTRKLHRWGFQRRLRGDEAGSYYHSLFQRDNEDLCLKMNMGMPSRDSCESLKSTESVVSDASSPLVAKSKSSIGDYIKEQSDGEKCEGIQASCPVPLLAAAQQPKPSELSVSTSILPNPSILPATPPNRQGNASSSNVNSGHRALEQLILARSLQARYRSVVYSRMLMNPMQGYVGTGVLPSAHLSALSANILNQTSGINAPPSEVTGQNQRQKITTGRYDIGSLSVLSMAPPSA